jgi:hypothetical protein
MDVLGRVASQGDVPARLDRERVISKQSFCLTGKKLRIDRERDAAVALGTPNPWPGTRPAFRGALPIMMAVFFGAINSGGSGNRAAMPMR